jgi:putative transcriptional regulator
MRRLRLIELRGNRSQEEVASKLNITRQMLSYIETGERTPSLPVARRIAEFYGVSVEIIFFDGICNETMQSPKVSTDSA